ncbi:restriction endonuclease, partial [Hydrocoleum sp. CS-953]|uniref:restriction endonuclease n=1 Tax=Hydrocoleum sp. CS-953 TaxID=1671698 RepID=UPI00352B1464
MLDITKNFKVIVPKNWTPKQKGDFWEKTVADLFRQLRLEVSERISFTGSEIDVLAENKETNERAFIECKFYTKGTISAEVIDKLLGKAYRKNTKKVYLACSAEFGGDAKGVIKELKEEYQDPNYYGIRAEFWGPEKLAEVFMDIKSIKLPDWNKYHISKFNTATLLVTPSEILWVVEEISEGTTSRAVIFPTKEDQEITNIEELKSDFNSNDFLSGLPIIDSKTIQKESLKIPTVSVSELTQEVVSQMGKAESFDDYSRPCNPNYFVGRKELKDKFWQFVKNVKDAKTSTRIVAFSGNSGLGKSSLVIKLEAESRDKYNDFYLYQVDVRSAQSSLFVLRALQKAIQKSIDDNFINLPGHKVQFGGLEQPFFNDHSLNKIIEQLRSNNRVLIIFFDQFEHLFTTKPLFGVYERFQKLAYEIDELEENIILCFCWRTGIMIPDGHKAYHLWHNLEDKIEKFEVKKFADKESEELLKQFNLEDNTLQEWLIEHCQDLPWLLKKTCSHISKKPKLKSSFKSQIDIKKLIKKLFDQDYDKCTSPKQKKCLKYLAENTIIDKTKLVDQFGYDIVNYLEDKRLIISSGLNYTVYWDLFREYLAEGKLPEIHLDFDYIPKYNINKPLEVFDLIASKGAEGIKYTEILKLKNKIPQGTLKNIRDDLRRLGLVEYKSPILKINSDLLGKTDSDSEIANYLANILNEHIVIKEIYQ